MSEAAESRYMGARATLTMSPSREVCFLHIAVKRPTDRWDEWGLIMPAVRFDGADLGDHCSAAEALQQALQLVLSGQVPG